ncbi:MAG: hypothetical protein QM493_04125 [Sulfurovum sp.]
MALKIKDGKVINIAPPRNLTKKELKKIEDAPLNKALIKSATSRKYNVVSA